MTNCDRLVCPKCKGNLSRQNDTERSENESMICESCENKYPLADGIIDFRVIESKTSDMGWSNEEFEDMYKKYGDWDSIYDWDKIRGLPKNATEYRYDKLKRNIIEMMKPQKGDCVLELGCGNGYFLVEVVEKFQEKEPDVNYIGFDVSRYNIINFHKKIRSKKLNNISAFVCNGEHLPFESDSMNLTISLEVLEHIADKESALKEVYRVLVPGGTFLFTTPSETAVHNWNILLFPFRIMRRLSKFRLKRKAPLPPYDEPISKGRYMELFRKIGFSKIELDSAQMLNDEVLIHLPKSLLNSYVSITKILENKLSFMRKMFGLHIIGRVQK